MQRISIAKKSFFNNIPNAIPKFFNVFFTACTEPRLNFSLTHPLAIAQIATPVEFFKTPPSPYRSQHCLDSSKTRWRIPRRHSLAVTLLSPELIHSFTRTVAASQCMS